MNRIKREVLYLEMARLASKRSTCNRLNVGAIVVNGKNNKILSMGYNGSLKGHPHCTKDGCCIVDGHCVRAEHAEVNALNCLERKYEELTLFCTAMPCLRCLRRCLQDSVTKIYFEKWYDDKQRDTLFLNEHTKNLTVIQLRDTQFFSESKIIFKNGVLYYDKLAE